MDLHIGGGLLIGSLLSMGFLHDMLLWSVGDLDNIMKIFMMWTKEWVTWWEDALHWMRIVWYLGGVL